MSDLDYDALRKVAEAATPGPWEYYDVNEGTMHHPGWEVANDAFHNPPADDDAPWLAVELRTGVEADAQHIATFDPPTVLRLLDLAQRAEADRAAIKMLHAKYAGRSKWVGYEKPRREAWAEIESDLRAALDPQEDQ